MNRNLLSSYTFLCLIIQTTILPVNAARPFATDDAGTVAQSTFELETGCDFWKDATVLGIGLKHGITNRMDIGIGFGYTPLPKEERRFQDAALGLKFGLIPDLFALSASGSFGNNSYGINAIISKAVGPISFDGNLGIEAAAATNDGVCTYGLCCHCDFERCAVGCEICGTHRELLSWQSGCNFIVVDWLTMDAGINGDFEKDMTLSATAGFTFAFPVPKTDD